jgi:hypothetical protein
MEEIVRSALALCQALWDNFGITSLHGESSADDLLEALRADAVLARMELHEDLAALAEEETDEALRRTFAERYRRLVGILPHQRKEFRRGLERIEAGSGMPVGDLVALFRRGYEPLLPQ